MGTQQLLLIVLSVIIVGIAIAVGISMFANQSFISNRQAIAAELTNYASLVIQFWKTPMSMGGAGQLIGNVTRSNIANYIGFGGAPNFSVTSPNGEFRVINVTGSIVTLKGKGSEKKGDSYAIVTTTIDLANNTINTTTTLGLDF